MKLGLKFGLLKAILLGAVVHGSSSLVASSGPEALIATDVAGDHNLVKRAAPVDFCRWWGHQSVLLGDSIYINGGIKTFKEDYRNASMYLFWGMGAVRTSEGFTTPLLANDRAFDDGPGVQDMESTQQGGLWADANKNIIYKFGGSFADKYSWTAKNNQLRGAQLWQYDIGNTMWANQALSPSNLIRAYGGAYTTNPGSRKGYYLGGIADYSTDPAYADFYGYQVLGDSFLVLDTDGVTFENKSTPDLDPLALGTLVHIPYFGSEGVLVLIGGLSGPNKQLVVSSDFQTSGVTARPMDTVHVYDIGNDRWFAQKTSGSPPSGRIQFCSSVVPAQDNSSFSVVIFGGNSVLTGSMFGDTWVLSIPSFEWIKVDDAGEKKFQHTCHIVKKSKLLVIGGRDFKQDVYSVNKTKAQDWTCLEKGIVNILDLNTFQWQDSLSADAEDYVVEGQITAVIGGDGTGKATKVAPDAGWGDSALGDLLKVPTPTSTQTPTKAPGSKTPIGPIVGGAVGGVVGVALIALGFILFSRHRKNKKAQNPAPGPIPEQQQVVPAANAPLMDTSYTQDQRYSVQYPGSPPPPGTQYYQQQYQQYATSPPPQPYYNPTVPGVFEAGGTPVAAPVAAPVNDYFAQTKENDTAVTQQQHQHQQQYQYQHQTSGDALELPAEQHPR